MAKMTQIDPATARAWLEAGEAELLDVREPDEHARERIKGARLVPLSRFDPDAAAPLRARKLIVHCHAGMRSAAAIARLSESDVEYFNLAGGIDAWKRSGLPVESGPVR